MKKLFIIIMTIFLGSSVFAQSPQKMSYQAVIRDAGGVLQVNQNMGMKISILQGSLSGTAVYEETHSTSSNANGLVSIEIGTGTPITGTFNTIDWSSGPYFLQSETDPTGGTSYTITGSSELLSVPYALHAGNAVWQQNGNDIYYNAGNVGIGTSTPAAGNGLHIKTLNANIRFEDTDPQAGDVYSIVNNTLGNDVLNFAIYNKTDERAELSFDGAGNVALLNGNLGVGTSSFSSPSTKLEICGTNTDADGNITDAIVSIKNNNYSRFKTAAFSNTSFRNSQIIGVRGRGTSSSPQDVVSGDRVFGMYGSVYAGGVEHNRPIASIEYYVGDTPKSGEINFSTLSPNVLDREERMRIDNDGNVGIGTTDPKEKLHIKSGDIYLEDIGAGIIMKAPNGGCWKLTIDNSGALTQTSIICP